MANVLNNLAADIYTAADKVGQEVVGFIPSATINSEAANVAKDGIVRSAFTSAPTEVDIAPSMTIPEGNDQTVTNKTMTINKSKAIQIPYTGEDQKHLNNGAGFETVYGNQIKQAMRKLTNLVERDAAIEAYTNASRAVGTAGTTPFASNFDLIAEARQIILDNGGDVNGGEMSLVMSTTAGTKLRNLAQLQKANENGSDEMLRQGTLLDLQGVMMKESAQILSHTKGDGASYQLSAAAAVGAETLSVDTGSGTILAGDIITLAGDSNNYVVNGALSGGDLTIGETGLIAAAADNAALTVGNNYTPNVMFHQSALEIAMRAPATPDGGDSADDAMLVQDPRSGLVFEIRFYKGYRKTMIEVALAWGVKAWNPYLISTVMG